MASNQLAGRSPRRAAPVAFPVETAIILLHTVPFGKYDLVDRYSLFT